MATTNALEVGKKYRTRDGQIVEIDDHDDTPSNPFPFSGYVDGNYFSWKPDGTFFDAQPNDMDLVEEIPDAAPEYRYFRFDSQDRNIGGNSRPSMILTALGSLSAMAGSPPPGETTFSRLSEAAQDLIVSATLGEFDETGPPEMPPEVRAELEQWAAESEEENA